MGQDYSYSQPSSSEEYDIGFACLLQGEADAYRDEADSSWCIAEPICYCGGQPVLATSYTSKDPGRRYFTCRNVDDGDCHIWKWYDVAVMEELSDFGRQLREVKDQCYVTDEKLVRVAKRVCELVSKKEAGCRSVTVVDVCILVVLVVVVAVWW
ncbi:hypothetical protein N665_0025s0071 [Sinapis alba]|nr:hypothetical protein N665_0025s0071 [Sinapis alba]